MRTQSHVVAHASRRCACILACVFGFRVLGAEIDLARLPPPAAGAIDFDRDIKPIFQNTCFRCHGPEKPKSHFSLVSRDPALKGGNNNRDDVIPGNSGGSKLVFYTARLVPDLEMPPAGKGEPLTAEQVGLLRAWIDQGASWGAPQPSPATAFSLAPTLRWTSVSGDRRKFRELEGFREGWGGGVKYFSLDEQDAPGERFHAEGHFLFPDEDQQLKLDWTRTEAGFVRAGFDRWRKYYDDTGGFTPATNSFNLDRDLHLNLGRAWIDLGLTLPDRPQIVLGYEYQFKEGDKSTLQWGPAGTNAPSKNVFPAFKHIDEDTHILKLDLNYERDGWRLEDAARVEFYRLATSRATNVLAYSPGGSVAVASISENDHHIQGANTFSVSKQFTDWLSASSGYLYSKLEGNAAYQQSTLDGFGNPSSGDQWSVDNITLKRESQVVSFGSLAGPWSGLSLSAGVQGEWTRQESMGEAIYLSISRFFTNVAATNVLGKLDSASARENLSLRYTRIPYTVLFAEARLRQESLARFDEGEIDATPFNRNTDADMESEECRAGFNTSPWQRLSLGASFKHSRKHTDYANTNSLSGGIYPGFILWRDIGENQVEARLVYRATSWLKTSLNYLWRKTDFDSATAPGVLDGLTPGGAIEAGDQEAHVYSFNAALTPLRRLYLSSTFSWSESRIATALDGANGLVPWQGNVYSVLSSATFALNPRTDLTATYVYSRSDYAQGNQGTGLPAGINYQRHGLQVGVTRRFTKNLETSLRYGFDQYHEPTSGGVNNFTAHAVFATVAMPLP